MIVGRVHFEGIDVEWRGLLWGTDRSHEREAQTSFVCIWGLASITSREYGWSTVSSKKHEYFCLIIDSVEASGKMSYVGVTCNEVG